MQRTCITSFIVESSVAINVKIGDTAGGEELIAAYPIAANDPKPEVIVAPVFALAERTVYFSGIAVTGATVKITILKKFNIKPPSPKGGRKKKKTMKTIISIIILLFAYTVSNGQLVRFKRLQDGYGKIATKIKDDSAFAENSHTNLVTEWAVKNYLLNHALSGGGVGVSIDTTHQSTAGGTGALINNTGTQNTGFGYTTLNHNTTGIGNAAFGDGAMQANRTGVLNTGIGTAALWQLYDGNNNVGVGYWSLSKLKHGN